MAAKKKVAVEFEGSAVDARAFARAVAAVLEASRLGDARISLNGFTMNRGDAKWIPQDTRITVEEL